MSLLVGLGLPGTLLRVRRSSPGFRGDGCLIVLICLLLDGRTAPDGVRALGLCRRAVMDFPGCLGVVVVGILEEGFPASKRFAEFYPCRIVAMA